MSSPLGDQDDSTQFDWLKPILEKDYRSQSTLSLYSTQPPDEQDNLWLEGEEELLEKELGSLGRCHLKNHQLPQCSKADATIVLDSFIVGGIRKRVTQVWIYFYDEEGYLDSFAVVRRHVHNECEAYQRLIPLQGSQVPTFLGLYLAALSAPDDPAWPTPSSSRNVYVLLTEFVEGTVLGDMRTEELSKDERRQIMDEVFELESHLFTLGVRHDDYRPQNLILLPQTVGSIGLTLLVLDFEQCSFYASGGVQISLIGIVDGSWRAGLTSNMGL